MFNTYYLYLSLFHKTSSISVGSGSRDNIIGGGGSFNDCSIDTHPGSLAKITKNEKINENLNCIKILQGNMFLRYYIIITIDD